MNAQDILHYIITHSEMLIGISIGLALLTVIFILILPASVTKTSHLDLKSIEETLKKVIDKIPQGQITQAPKEQKASSIQDEEDEAPIKKPDASAPAAMQATSAPVVDTAALDKLKATVGEREQKIKQLESELSQAKQAAQSAPAISAGASDDALAKIQELQSKLSEYAIIEEELADISKFKEENARLKIEIETIKASGGGAPAAELAAAPVAAVEPASQVAPTPVAAAPPVTEGPAAVAPPAISAPVEAEVPVVQAQEAPVEATVVTPSKAPVAEAEDQVLKDFQQVVDMQAAPKISVTNEVSNNASVPPVDVIPPMASFVPPVVTSMPNTSSVSPLDGSVDTSKMLQEIEKLGGGGEDAEADPMAGLLDTEKLLAEVRELGGPKNPNEKEQSAVDDLMSEFEAEQQQIKAKA